MALKNTTKGIHDLLASITSDLQKADNGNKAAAQRVRTGTIKLEKLAKVYRKESIADEKKSKGTKKTKSAAHKPAAKKAAPKAAHKPAAKKAAHKPAAKKAAHKPAAKKAAVKAAHHAVRRPTAKLHKKKK